MIGLRAALLDQQIVVTGGVLYPDIELGKWGKKGKIYHERRNEVINGQVY